MKSVYRKRWLRFYRHVKQPIECWSVDKFSFDFFRGAGPCGTCGCLAGELPAIYKSWYWGKGAMYHKGNTGPSVLSNFFGVPVKEIQHVFYPISQDPAIDPYYRTEPHLKADCTKEQAVANLERYLKIKGIL